MQAHWELYGHYLCSCVCVCVHVNGWMCIWYCNYFPFDYAQIDINGKAYKQIRIAY